MFPEMLKHDWLKFLNKKLLDIISESGLAESDRTFLR